MNIYTSIVLLTVLVTSLSVSFQSVASQSTKMLSSIDSEQLLTATAKRTRDKSPQRGSGRREFFELHQEVIPLA